MPDKPRILFMGTPEFAVPSLAALAEQGYPIVGVVTQPDRPKGRGRETAASPVKVFAEKHGLPVMQPERLRDDAFLKQFNDLSPDMVALAAFGQILPETVINGTKLGCINVHPSLLPKYRGAAPINWAIIRGEEKTGVTIMLMAEGLDNGDIIVQQETPIGPEETYGELHDRLAVMGADLLIAAIKKIEAGKALFTKQHDIEATYAPRLNKEDGLIRWDAEAAAIMNLIRGLSPTPGAYTFLDGKMLKILAAAGDTTGVAAGAAEPGAGDGGVPGTILAETERGLPVATGNGRVYLREVQLEGKKRMPIREFLRGYRIEPGRILGKTA